jgi:hypothetical protein
MSLWNFWIKYFHLILTKINCITLNICSKADFKSKSQNIWQQIILFSRTVMQRICAIQDLNSFGEIIAHREEKFWSDDCRSWPHEEKINNHGGWGKQAHIPDNDYWGICLFHVVWKHISTWNMHE